VIQPIGNSSWRDPNVGVKDQWVSVPYVLGQNTVFAHLNTAYYHVHGTPFVYPDLADAVTLTSASPAWDDSGSIIEVIPADTLTVSDFDLHFINISDISGDAQIQIDIFKGLSGEEVKISSTRAVRTGGAVRNAPQRIQIPQQVSGERISCRLSDSSSSSKSCDVSFEGHYYAG